MFFLFPYRGTFRAIWRSLFLLGMASLLSNCSTVKVRKENGALFRESLKSARVLEDLSTDPDPELRVVSRRSVELLRDARRQENFGAEGGAPAAYLKAAVEARASLAGGRGGAGSEVEKELMDLHNHALARFAELWSEDPRRTGGGPYLLRFREETFEIVESADSDYESAYFDRAVATESIKGKGVVDKHRPGFGASLVGVREKTPERAEEMSRFPDKGLFLPVTLTIDRTEDVGAEGKLVKRVFISLNNPTRRETTTVGEREFPLATDFSAPMELLLKGRNEVIWGLKGFFNAKQRAEESGLYLLEPYDPERIPVVLTHGLISVPIIWRDIIPEFLSEPDIAKRYQFMLFTYPSSFPIPESARLFRDELEAIRSRRDPDRNDPLSTNMVAIGHSMGGVLTHLLVAEVEDRFWNELSDVPLDEIPISPENAELIRSLVYFEPDPAVQRAVFISTPHRGASLATLRIADFASRLARLPTDLLITTIDMLDVSGPVSGLKVDLSKKMTSVQSLRPDSPVSKTLDAAPFKPGVTYHSIIGDRGKGDTPNSSDGVVEYWSSHQSGAESELIVPTGHTSYTHPDAIADMKRILRLHAGLE